MAAQPGLFTAGAAPSREALKAAQARLMGDGSLQFGFTHAAAARPPAPTPAWLKALISFFNAAGHLLGWVFWAGVALAAAAIVGFIVLEIVRTRWPGLFKRKPRPRLAPVDWRPEAAVARALLEEADRLAAEGNYAEAVRLLLHRSIEDIEGRRPRLVRPAFTAREIACLEDLPSPARTTFGSIAQVVERSLFGGRDVDAAGFAECRKAYEAFAFPGSWA